MSFPTTISLTARVDMQDEVEGFLHNKSLPGARVRLGDQWCEHRFTEPGEEHRFTVTADLDEPDQHEVLLEFVDRVDSQGAIEITALHINGAPMGMRIFQCDYTPYHSGTPSKSHLYMGWPGTWRLRLNKDDFRHAGFRFV